MSETPRFTPARLRELAEVAVAFAKELHAETDIPDALRYAADVLEAHQGLEQWLIERLDALKTKRTP